MPCVDSEQIQVLQAKGEIMTNNWFYSTEPHSVLGAETIVQIRYLTSGAMQMSAWSRDLFGLCHLGRGRSSRSTRRRSCSGVVPNKLRLSTCSPLWLGSWAQGRWGDNASEEKTERMAGKEGCFSCIPYSSYAAIHPLPTLNPRKKPSPTSPQPKRTSHQETARRYETESRFVKV